MKRLSKGLTMGILALFLIFCAAPSSLLLAQSNSTQVAESGRLITGKVVDASGEGIPGVKMQVKDSTRGGITSFDGTFSLRVKPNEKIIIFSYVGLKTVEQDITTGNSFTVLMEEDAEILQEIVVTGYQSISKERVTGSFAVVNTDDLKSRRQPDILGQLEGQVAGLVQKDGMISIRGFSTIYGVRKPLYVVDGMPFEGNIKSINPATISKVTVLKDAAAASIYGARAANGVIVINTINGSSDGKVHISYDGNIRFTSKPNWRSFDLLSTAETIDLQRDAFDLVQEQWEPNLPYVTNPIKDLLLQHREGLISDKDLDDALAKYKALDNRSQLEKFYLQTGIMHQHNLGVSGGNERHKYFATINYLGNRGTSKYSSNERVGFTLRNNMKFLPWLSADISVSADYSSSHAFNGGLGFGGFFSGRPSYEMLYDEKGNPLNVPDQKSEMELKRLLSVGLMDEHFSPVKNLKEERSNSNDQYYRVQGGLNFALMEGLDFDVRFQTENSTYLSKQFYSPKSYTVRSMINNAAQIDPETKEIKYNVPIGGQLSEERGGSTSWTLRPQLRYDNNFGRHSITALLGSEFRSIKYTATRGYYMGYDENSLAFKPVQPEDLFDMMGTESMWGNFNWDYSAHNYFIHSEDRFVSLYANASYSLDSKLNLTGSIRMDQSNLFGTDPKFQYRPLWSLGASYDLSQEKFMDGLKHLDQLKLRLTYGIGGNIPKDVGPYLILSAPGPNPFLDGEFGSSIASPPNASLRWEKTSTFNAGIDFSMFQNRLSGSFDVYNKYTVDLLANRNADPTLGWGELMLNYGSMINRGVELTLMGGVIDRNDFKWDMSYIFSYNRSKMLTVDDSNKEVFNYSRGNTYSVGYPAGSVFSFRYAGLNPEDGTPLYYTKDGEKVSYIVDVEDLVYSGTIIPPFSSSWTNMLSYKGLNLSFMFNYFGGHVVRYEAAPYRSFAPSVNANRQILNRWKQPGDEKNESCTPALTGTPLDTYVDIHPWRAADKHVIKGDYISLRTLSLGYDLDKKLFGWEHIEGITLTLQAENLFLIPLNKKGINPDALTTSGYGWGAQGYATPSTFTLGMSVKF